MRWSTSARPSNLRSRVRSYFDAGRGDDRALRAAARRTCWATSRSSSRAPRRRRCSSRTSSSRGTSRASTSGSATTRTSSSCASTSGTRIRAWRCAGRGRSARRGARYLRALLIGLVHPRDAAGRQPPLPAPHLHRPRLRPPQAPLHPVPDQALPGALRLRGAARRSTGARWRTRSRSWRGGRASSSTGSAARMDEAAARTALRGGGPGPRPAPGGGAQPGEAAGAVHRPRRPRRVRPLPRGAGPGGPGAVHARRQAAGLAAASPSAARSSRPRRSSPPSSSLFYEQNPAPDEVLLPLEPVEAEALAEVLSERRARRVRLLTPQRGAKADLLEVAARNAEQSFRSLARARRAARAGAGGAHPGAAPGPRRRAGWSATTSPPSRARWRSARACR